MKLSRITLIFLILLLIIPFGVQAQDDVDVMDPATFGLQEGKPFDGVSLDFLICCNTAPQFASLAAKTNSEFTEMTGITVTWGDLPFGSFQEQLYLEATNPNTDYDLAAWVDAWGTNIYDVFYPLNDFVADNGIDFNDYSPAYQAASSGGTVGTDEEVIYGLPLRGHPQMLFYRSDVFEELGLDVPQTWQEVAVASEAIVASGMDISPIAMYYGINTDQNLFNWYSHLWGAGTDLFDENWEPSFNNEAGLAATEQYLSYLGDGYTQESAITWTEQEAGLEFQQGRAAMYVSWWWKSSSFFNSEVPEVAENTGFAPAPGWEGGSTASYGYLWPVSVLAASDNIDASLEYMKWLTHPITERRVVLADDDPAFDTNVAVRLSILADEEVNAAHNGLQGVASSILAEARTIPLIPEYTEMIPILAEAINELATNPDADVQAVLDLAAEDIRFVLEDAGYYD